MEVFDLLCFYFYSTIILKKYVFVFPNDSNSRVDGELIRFLGLLNRRRNATIYILPGPL